MANVTIHNSYFANINAIKSIYLQQKANKPKKFQSVRCNAVFCLSCGFAGKMLLAATQIKAKRSMPCSGRCKTVNAKQYM